MEDQAKSFTCREPSSEYRSVAPCVPERASRFGHWTAVESQSSVGSSQMVASSLAAGTTVLLNVNPAR
jgi:hypothetical protein